MSVALRRLLVAAVLFLSFLALYAATAAPGLLFHDSAEFQTVGVLGGIPHSTGYPTFVLLGRVFAAIVPGDPAWRMNVMSATCGAAAVAAAFGALVAFGLTLRAAALTSIAFGLSFTFWRASQRAEVYSLALLFGALAMAAVFTAWRTRRLRDALLSALFMGLAVCSHLSFAPAVKVAGLALAILVARSARPRVPALLALLFAFALGLSPFLFIPWADAHHVPANFLDHVSHLKQLLGASEPPFETPWDRLRWLVLGGNYFPPRAFVFDAHAIGVRLAHATFILGAFEPGPLAALFAALGLRYEWKARRSLAVVLVLGLAAGSVFAAAVQDGAMLHLLQLPSMLIALPLIGRGVEAPLEIFRRQGPILSGAAWLVLLAALVIPPHAIRLYAERSPIGPKRYRVLEEPSLPPAGRIPSLAGNREAEAYSRSALAAMPQRALVLATWATYTPLRHVRLLEHQRPDLTLELATIETAAIRVRQWRSDPATRRRAIVFTESNAMLDPFRAGLDSIPLASGRALYVLAPNRRVAARAAAPDTAGRP